MRLFLLIFLYPTFFLFSQTFYSVDYAYQADIKVHIVDYEYQADLLVYKLKNKYEAKGNSGLWYFSDYAYQADFKVFFV
ncbi:DUF6150 family protein, partial [Flavobacteriaceae bacterium]|nr:DUF6150 family protein [Flavobacteriaceae bacterium]